VRDFLDANPVLRYLIEDNPPQTARARALIESDRPLWISILTLAEVGYVLTRVYRVARADAVDALIGLLDRANIQVHEIETDLAVQALRLCRPSGRVNFADALLWAVARTAAPARVWSFDERFPADGIELRQP
jgi:predicted nucleic acid-binding protein